MKMENFEKTTYTIGKLRKKYVENAYQTIFLSTFEYHKHELEIARFGAHAPRAGTVDVKRLICAATYLKNRTLTNTIARKTLYEISFKRKPNVEHLRLYGSKIFVRKPEKNDFLSGIRKRKWVFY